MIINKENKTDIIKASILALIYALFFSIIYIGETSVIYISIYCILSVSLSVLIASNIKSKEEGYFRSSLIKKLIVAPFFLKKLVKGLIIVLINHAENPTALKLS